MHRVFAAHRLAEIRSPVIVILGCIDGTQSFSPDYEVGRVDGAIAIEVAGQPGDGNFTARRSSAS